MNTSTATRSAPVGNTPPDALTAFLDCAEGEVGAWGERDCALWVGEWVRMRTGIDAGVPWRGTYGSEDECLALLEREGGILRVMQSAAAAAGLEVTWRAPRRGDIAVIQVGVSRGEARIAAIAVGRGRWAAMSADGLRVIRAEPVMVWSVP